MSKRKVIWLDEDLVHRLIHSRDIWQIRALALASMINLLGIDSKPVLEADKDVLMGYILRSGAIMNVVDMDIMTLEGIIDLLATPIMKDERERADE